jgi:NAD(P)-dependent dehydrogenase (short-subunit alcohol dehydrogenase family)
VTKEALKFKTNFAKLGSEYRMRTPLNRMGKAEEIASMALVLACNTSSYVNGAMIVVDSGFLSV